MSSIFNEWLSAERGRRGRPVRRYSYAESRTDPDAPLNWPVLAAQDASAQAAPVQAASAEAPVQQAFHTGGRVRLHGGFMSRPGRVQQAAAHGPCVHYQVTWDDWPNDHMWYEQGELRAADEWRPVWGTRKAA